MMSPSEAQLVDLLELKALAEREFGPDQLWWIEPTITLAPDAVPCMGRGAWPTAPFDELWLWRTEGESAASPPGAQAWWRRILRWIRPAPQAAAVSVAVASALHAVRLGAGKQNRYRVRLFGAHEAAMGQPHRVWPAGADMRARHGAPRLDSLPEADWQLTHDPTDCRLQLHIPRPMREVPK